MLQRQPKKANIYGPREAVWLPSWSGSSPHALERKLVARPRSC